MCSNMGAGARRAATPQAPAQQAAAPAPAPAAPQRAAGGLMSDTGIQNMDDATLTALITRAMRSGPITRDGRQDTPAQRIADALGVSANVPESVPQEALAQYRSRTGDAGTLYRTVDDVSHGPTGRQIAHDLTTSTNYGLNFGGGRVWGTGLYFAGRGPRDSQSAAYHSSNYGAGPSWGSYTIEARIRPGARIARDRDFTSAAAKNWIRTHSRALLQVGIHIDASGQPQTASGAMSNRDARTTLAMLMGYDGYSNDRGNVPYYTIWNRGALQVARGNKYDRASRGQI